MFDDGLFTVLADNFFTFSGIFVSVSHEEGCFG